MSITDLLDVPVRSAAPAVRTRRVFDLSGGRCAIDVVLAPLGLVAWRVRLQPVTIRIVEDGAGGAEIAAHLSARPRYASLPATAGLFMPATDRSTILAVTAWLPSIEAGARGTVAGVVTRGRDEWPVELAVHVREIDDEHLVATVGGWVLRRDDLPLPGLRLGIDAALDLRRCA